MTFRNYLAGTIFIGLLVFVPFHRSWQGLLTILIPLTVWLLLGLIWKYWLPDNKIETTLKRILSLLISVALFTLAILEATSKTHIGNTQQIQTRDGTEDVGDYIMLNGPDWSKVFVIVIVALLFLWLGLVKEKTNNVK